MFLNWGVVIVQLCLVQGQSFNAIPLSESNRQTAAVVLPRHIFSQKSVLEAFLKAQDIINSREASITEIARITDLRQDIPSARHQRFQGIQQRSQQSDLTQELFEEATRVLIEQYKLTKKQIKFGVSDKDLQSKFLGNIVENCEVQYNESNCKADSRYRTFDGSCNNLQNPSWGRAATCFQRLLDPDYADGIAAKRLALSRNPLPPPRRVSLEIHAQLDKPTNYVSHLLMVFGQFLAHDISLTPLSKGPNNQPLECCPVGEVDPPQCDPILLQQDDPFFSSFGINCLNNLRSAKCSTCSLGPRQQINQESSYIDASHIYGLSQDASKALRNNDGTGTLRFVNHPEAGELPPPSAIPEDDVCSYQDPDLDCFETGDQRANQHPALTSMHVLFLREHNRLARRLRQLNVGWTDDQLFQESRRILGALLQRITYGEFLPLVIGQKMMNYYNLNVQHSGYTQYDPTVQANLFNEFSAAAFRFGHSMINSVFAQVPRGSNSSDRLRDIFMYPFGLYRGELDGLVKGLTLFPAQRFDRFMVRDVTSHLYQNRGNHTGLDLASLNINRGRDHGIPSYTRLVDFCGGQQITNWKQLDHLFQYGVRPLFQRIYEDVQDIDLFSGGMAERPKEGAVIGPTFTCILGIQFQYLKSGDRYYFEHGDQKGSFSSAQLQEIRNVTLSKIICNNFNLKRIQKEVMLQPSTSNPLVNCADLPEMNLKAWSQEIPN